MKNFTYAQKKALETYLETPPGAQVVEVAYNPETVSGNPEAQAIADGWTEYYREDYPSLVEVIYTKSNT